LSTSLPGFVAAPAGSFNGPVSSSTLLTYTHNPAMLAEIENGTISGYLRYWGRPYGRFNGILSDLVVKFPNVAQTTTFVDDLEESLTGQLNVRTFVPTTPSGAMGYSGHNAVVSGSTNYAVSFGRGDFASFVLSATPVGGVTSDQIQLMAYAQWSALPSKTAPGSTPTSQPSLVPTSVPAGSPAPAPGGLPQVSTGTPVTASASALSSSGVGGLEALAVIVVIVVVVFLLVAYAVDAVGRRRRERLGGGGESETGEAAVAGGGPPG
jgi:hypothetical protein